MVIMVTEAMVYKIIFYVPKSHVEVVKEAAFSAGAGKLGDYERCSWQVLGDGQFRPLSDSQPFIGRPGVAEQVAEYRVEMLCAEQYLEGTVKLLKQAHPYEEPAIDIILLHQM
jgi:hypothetical protein